MKLGKSFIIAKLFFVFLSLSAPVQASEEQFTAFGSPATQSQNQDSPLFAAFYAVKRWVQQWFSPAQRDVAHYQVSSLTPSSAPQPSDQGANLVLKADNQVNAPREKLRNRPSLRGPGIGSLIPQYRKPTSDESKVKPTVKALSRAVIKRPVQASPMTSGPSSLEVSNMPRAPKDKHRGKKTRPKEESPEKLEVKKARKRVAQVTIDCKVIWEDSNKSELEKLQAQAEKANAYLELDTARLALASLEVKNKKITVEKFDRRVSGLISAQERGERLTSAEDRLVKAKEDFARSQEKVLKVQAAFYKGELELHRAQRAVWAEKERLREQEKKDRRNFDRAALEQGHQQRLLEIKAGIEGHREALARGGLQRQEDQDRREIYRVAFEQMQVQERRLEGQRRRVEQEHNRKGLRGEVDLPDRLFDGPRPVDVPASFIPRPAQNNPPMPESFIPRLGQEPQAPPRPRRLPPLDPRYPHVPHPAPGNPRQVLRPGPLQYDDQGQPLPFLSEGLIPVRRPRT